MTPPDAAEGLRRGDRVERLEIGDAWLVEPWSGREGRACVRVESGRVVGVEWLDGSGPRGGDGERERVEPSHARGILVLPGLFDLHAHFREPGGEEAETIASGLDAAGRGGFTRVCLMPNTEPPVDSDAGVARARAAAEASGSPVAAYVLGTSTRGREGRALSPMGELTEAGAVGFSDDGSPIPDPALLRSALAYAAGLGRVVIEHPEERRLTSGAEAHEGVPSIILGLRGSPAAAESGAVAAALAVLAEVVRDAPPGATPRLHLTHLSTAASVELVRRAKAERLPVTCDVTPHHLALHDGWLGGDRRFAWEAAQRPWAGEPAAALPYDPATRVNPPLRSPADALALAAGLVDGTVDAIATDHAPHREIDKSVEFGDAANGISGIETAVGLLLHAVDAAILDLMTVVRALTTGPRRVLGQAVAPRQLGGDAHRATATRDGPFTAGALADLVVIDRMERWTVTRESLASRGKNTPLLGRQLPGRVLLTVAGGRLAYADPQFLAADGTT